MNCIFRYNPDLLDPDRLDAYRSLGFNVVRLGAMWTGFEPEQEGKVNTTYVNVLKVSFLLKTVLGMI